MGKFSSEIEIKRPVYDVFQYVADVKNNPLWQDVNSVKTIKKYKSGKIKS